MMIFYRNFVKMVVAENGDRVRDRLISFGHLAVGWHYGSGRPAPKNVVSSALRAYDLIVWLRGRNGLRVFPDIAGGILIAAGDGPVELEVFCRLNGKYDVLVERDDDPLYENSDINYDDLPLVLSKVPWPSRHLQGSSILNTMTIFEKGLKASPSKHRTMALPSCVLNARASGRIQNADTSRNSTFRERQVTQSYSFP